MAKPADVSRARRPRVDRQFVEARLRDVSVTRGGRPVLERVSWTIRPGERWVLAGANGAGKTQLLKLIAGAVWPTPGRDARQYLWKGEVWHTPQEVQEEIGYLGPERQDKYERYGWNHTAEEVVATGLYRTDIPLDAPTAADRKRVAAMLRRLRIDPLGLRRFLTLSYGERRLTLLARALVSGPKLLLLDELLNGLDEANRERALRWLQSTARSRLPWVLSTHRAEDVPSSATHALVLEHGRVAYRGPLRAAPLGRWLGGKSRPAPPRVSSSSRAGSVPGRLLVRMTEASVHLEGHVALHGVSLTIRSGECWVVHGHNGSGKTTLVRTLYGDHGVAVGGRIERAGIRPGVALQRFKRRVGLVAPHLQADHPQHLTVSEVVQSGRYASIGLNDPPTSADRAAARRAITQFGLTELGQRTLRELSYGQLRRVLFARAWVRRPALLLLDEPFSGLDGPTQHELRDRLGPLVAGGAVERTVDFLHRRGLLYQGVLEPPKGKTPEDWEAREQTLFRATDFGDDVDRPVRKSDGSNTYFLNDAAYHADKISRGFGRMIDVWGADHGGYVKRMQAAVSALSGDRPATLEIVLCQIVRVMKDGKPMRMSKRAGTYVELRDLIDQVGADVVRFLMLMRKSDAQMEFDLDAAVAETRENPVFYVQYAHARCRSVLRMAAGMAELGDVDQASLAGTDLSGLTAPEEIALIRKLAEFPRLIEAAATAREPHRLGFFLYDLAGVFHALWNKGRDDATLRFIRTDAMPETRARLALVAATAVVIRSGLAVMGVVPVEEMR